MFTQSLYSRRSHGRKKDSQVVCLFALLGSAGVKDAHSMQITKVQKIQSNVCLCVILGFAHVGEIDHWKERLNLIRILKRGTYSGKKKPSVQHNHFPSVMTSIFQY